MRSLLLLTLFLSVCTADAVCQPTSDMEAGQSDPKIAFLKSMAVPGWGHYYANKSNWTRGKYHLAADVGLILSFVGFTIHKNNLRQNWHTYGRSEAGVKIEGRSRQFQLAVGDFDNLDAYNDYQLRSRNWDRLYADMPKNRWNWSGDAQRVAYNDLRNRFETIDQQLPALIGLMVVNRIISGISAYNRARQQSHALTSSFYLSRQLSGGVAAHLKIQF